MDNMNITVENKQKNFEKTIDVVFFGLLLEIALFQCSGVLADIILKLNVLFKFQENSIAYNNFTEIVFMVLYIVSFVVPFAFIKRYAPNKSLHKEKIPVFKLKYIFIPLAIEGFFLFVSQFTFTVQSWLEIIGIGFLDYEMTVPDDAFGIVLLFVSSAVVPAIVEELVFRKAVLESLLPYGKIFASIVSALCFALMHCNPEQFLYAFAAGMVFAFITIKTKSVIPAMCIHFLNNAYSVLVSIMEKYMNEDMFYSFASLISLSFQFSFVVLFFVLYQKGFFKSIKKDEDIGFSVSKKSVRFFTVFYVIVTLILASRWIELL